MGRDESGALGTNRANLGTNPPQAGTNPRREVLSIAPHFRIWSPRYGQPSATRSASVARSGVYRPHSPQAWPTALNDFAT